MNERPKLGHYFNLHRGIPALKSRIPHEAQAAVEALFMANDLVAQQRTFDKDELIIPTDKLRRTHLIDIGISETDAVWNEGI